MISREKTEARDSEEADDKRTTLEWTWYVPYRVLFMLVALQ
jgi:hypothetical protein